MTTVYSELVKFCDHPPQKKDISNLGKQVASDFKNSWVPNLFRTVSANIPDAGMVYEKQADGMFTVNGYPNLYKERMLEIFSQYFNSAAKKKRKRIPVKGTKVGWKVKS